MKALLNLPYHSEVFRVLEALWEPVAQGDILLVEITEQKFCWLAYIHYLSKHFK